MQIVSLEPRLRFDRTHQGDTPALSRQSESSVAHAEAIVRIDDAALRVLVVLDPGSGPLTPWDRQLIAAARLMIGRDHGVVVAADRDLADAGPAGADRVLQLPKTDHPADRFEAVAKLHAALDLPHCVLPETALGGDLARRLSARLGVDLVANVEQMTARGVVRPVYGRRVDQEYSAIPPLLTLAADMVPLRTDPPREARVMPFEFPPPRRVAERREAPRDTLSLGDSDFVVSAGNGIWNFDLFRQVVSALGGTPGGSRVVCDSGQMPREAQVGASGTVLAADCYLALGIAGAPQHLQGIAGCRHVIAVNTDLHAAMVERAELSVIADAHPVMEALLRLLKKENA